MSRYIDAEKILPYISRLFGAMPLAVLKMAETDGVDIVRCKECIHNPWDFDQLDYTCVWDDDFADREQTPDDFCSYGEREGE